ncbi:hypothetical protein K505DRAFT_404790 [Melanomma pulvis-pyrius CBS 109.77]|uniref:U three protein 23 n=1 Tax=Melanomma pulvis-pyrius CBS 109.77 TaxID=1314802 RepID=A0A6A6XRU7_9PLEO|nr:hypothetical protein K505DRAFT_404790 [Melanomma pulvis-pyrius CBS 109.77]
MRGKRAKAYRKLMHQYELNFSFREPYQVLVDSAIVQDASRFKIDLTGRLQQVLQGTIKPMITQCDMRHLYDATPKDESVIDQAKQYERRRCNHHELEKPLSTFECLSSVVDPKGSLTNKNRYVVATQDPAVREHMRKIPGVPLIYISKSVMILEPMASATEQQREQEEKAKFKAGLKSRRGAQTGQKRKHDGEDGDSAHVQANKSITGTPPGTLSRREKKRAKGPKAPNPLSVKKPKKTQTTPPNPSGGAASQTEDTNADTSQPPIEDALQTSIAEDEESRKPKRRRKHKRKGDGGADAHTGSDAAMSDDL